MIPRYAIIIDLETLDTAPTAAITELAACLLDTATGDVKSIFYTPLNINQQPNSTIAHRNITWAMENIPASRIKDGESVHTPTRLRDFVSWVERCVVDISSDDFALYGNGANFDHPILKHALLNAGIHTLPWQFYQELCLRTLTTLMSTGDYKAAKGYATDHTIDQFQSYVKHDPRHDVVHEAHMLLYYLGFRDAYDDPETIPKPNNSADDDGIPTPESSTSH